MDSLSLNAIVFPVRRGTLARNEFPSGEQFWSIELYCAESPQLDYSGWTDDRAEGELDWVAGTEPYLYAQMLPLPVDKPAHLVTRTFSFPQSPSDDPAPWDRGKGWLFFGLYLWEHILVYPTTLTFVECQDSRYHVKIEGMLPCHDASYQVKADAWLEWGQ